MDILVVQPMATGPAGALGAVLEDRGARLDVRVPERGAALPEAADGYDGLVVLGGVMGAHDDDAHPHLAATARLICGFHERDKAVLGVCLGAQLIARALGGRAYPHAVPELGFTPLEWTLAAANDALLAGVRGPLRLMQWHYDTLELPPGARLLATSPLCRNQAFRVGEATYGFQCHFEVTRALVERWVADSRASLTDARHRAFFARVSGELDAHLDASLGFCRTVGGRWAALAAARRAA